jgi:hypothetical protein
MRRHARELFTLSSTGCVTGIFAQRMIAQRHAKTWRRSRRPPKVDLTGPTPLEMPAPTGQHKKRPKDHISS